MEQVSLHSRRWFKMRHHLRKYLKMLETNLVKWVKLYFGEKQNRNVPQGKENEQCVEKVHLYINRKRS